MALAAGAVVGLEVVAEDFTEAVVVDSAEVEAEDFLVPPVEAADSVVEVVVEVVEVVEVVVDSAEAEVAVLRSAVLRR